MIHTIDLHFLDTPEAIAAYCIPTEKGAILVETGPYSTTDHLVAGLVRLGLQPADIHTVLLTHIHFDHAGAAWWWALQGATVYVHPVGRPHLISPGRLYESARRLYGDMMETLWGKMQAIEEDRVVAVADREVLSIDDIQIVAHHTPGHASHHIAWQLADTVFTGDVGGVKIQDGPVVPPCPPPDVRLDHWYASIDRLRSLDARRFYLTHYGPVEPTGPMLDELESRLQAVADWVKPYAEQDADPKAILSSFVDFLEHDYRQAGTDEGIIKAYRAANPPDMSLAGLMRYWNKYGLTNK